MIVVRQRHGVVRRDDPIAEQANGVGGAQACEWHDALTRETFCCSGSALEVPDGPGLGIDLDAEAVLRYLERVD